MHTEYCFINIQPQKHSMLPCVVASETNTSLLLWHTSITFPSVTGEADSPYVGSKIADTLTVLAKIDVLRFARRMLRDPSLSHLKNGRCELYPAHFLLWSYLTAWPSTCQMSDLKNLVVRHRVFCCTPFRTMQQCLVSPFGKKHNETESAKPCDDYLYWNLYRF